MSEGFEAPAAGAGGDASAEDPPSDGREAAADGAGAASGAAFAGAEPLAATAAGAGVVDSEPSDVPLRLARVAD